MLEHIGSNAHDLYQDLTQANNSSWQQFVLEGTGQTDNASHYFIVDPTSGTFHLSSTGRYLRQFFTYVRPGYTRVGATTTVSGLEPVAFKSPSGAVTLVANAPGATTLVVGGLPAGTYQVSYTTSSQTLASGAPITITAGQSLSTTIPAAGTITIHH
jgi:glucosylceramidase